MSSTISRRKVVTGVAWSAPVIVASSAVPAFAASPTCEWDGRAAYSAFGTNTGAKTVQEFTIPAKVEKIRFEIIGGAGGAQYPDVPAGSGAKVTGTIAVSEGQVVQIVAAAGGVGNMALTPSIGGEGYGNGGSSSLASPIPSGIISRVNERWSVTSSNKRITYSASGGGSSALLVDGTVMVIAGGGGGAGFINAGGANNEPNYMKPGAVDAGYLWPENALRNAFPVLGSTGGSASAVAGSAGNAGSLTRTADTTQVTVVEAGGGGSAGTGGSGGSATVLPTGASTNGVIGYYSTNNQEIFSSSTAGAAGGNGFTGAGADGVGSYSYMIDNNDKSLGEPGTENKPLEYSHIGYNFNGYQSVISAGGGAGYGGGGSGASTSAVGIVLTQKWNNNPNGVRQNTDFGQLGGGGGAGGSYVAPSVLDSAVTAANNAPKGRGARGNGSVKVTFCRSVS